MPDRYFSNNLNPKIESKFSFFVEKELCKVSEATLKFSSKYLLTET
jgi:hypothetical protein